MGKVQLFTNSSGKLLCELGVSFVCTFKPDPKDGMEIPLTTLKNDFSEIGLGDEVEVMNTENVSWSDNQ